MALDSVVGRGGRAGRPGHLLGVRACSRQVRQVTLDLKKRAGIGACRAARRTTGMTPDGLAWLIGSMEEVFIAPGDRGPAKRIQTTLLHIGARQCFTEAGTRA